MAGSVLLSGLNVVGQNAGLAVSQLKNVGRSKQTFMVLPPAIASAKCCCSPSRTFLSGSSMLLPRRKPSSIGRHKDSAVQKGEVTCGLLDYVGRDLLRFDTGKWYEDVEQNGAMAIYMPLEGGPEGRYVLKLKQEGYHILNLNARGLGDPEAYLMKVHGVRPVSCKPFTTLNY